MMNLIRNKYDIIIRLRFDMLLWSRRERHSAPPTHVDFPLNKFTGPHYYNEHNIT